MMRFILFILVLVVVPISYSQEWRDSLIVARKSYKSGNYEKAIRYYKAAQSKAPKSVDLSDEIAQSAYKLREFEKAEKIYNQSSSKLSKKKKSIAYHNIGNSRMQQKNYQGAIDSYKEALKNNPNDNETRYNLSEAIRRLKDQQKKNDSKQNQKDQNKDQSKNKNNNKDQDKNKQSNKDQNKKKSDSQNDQAKNNQTNKSKLPNKSVDKMLDKLMKQEAETKKRATTRKGDNLRTVSGKDW